MFGKITSSIGTFLKSKSSAFFGQTRGGIVLGPIEKEEAQQVTVYNNCLLLIADLISSLEWSADVKKIDRIIKKPNPWQTTNEFFYSVVYDLINEGASFIEIQGETSGMFYLAPISPDEIQPAIVEGKREYRISPSDGSLPYNITDDKLIKILDIPTSNALEYTSRKDMCTEALRKIISIDRYVRDLCDNGPVIGMQINAPDFLEPEEAKKVEQEYIKQFGKVSYNEKNEQITGKNRAGIAILGGGAQINTVGPTLDFSAQMLQAYRREEYKVCGVFKMPAFMAGVSEGDTKYSNFTAQQSGLYRDGIEPIVTRVAKALSRALKANVTADLNKFIAGDLASASEIGGKNYERGGWSQNEYRKITGKPPVEGGDEKFRDPDSSGNLIRPDDGMDPGRPRSGPDDDIDPGNLDKTPDEDL